MGRRAQKIGLLIEQIKLINRLGHKHFGVGANAGSMGARRCIKDALL